MAAITISRQLGSEGTYIVKKVAEALGYHFVDKKILERMFTEYGFVYFRDKYDSTPGFWARFDEIRAEMTNLLDKFLLALAKHGDVVILGRGGFVVLGGFSDVLNVRIQAPLPVRIQRVMEREKITEPERAESLIKESDRLRGAFVEFSYGIQWDAATVFDLVIDTGKIVPDLAVNWLVQALPSVKERSKEGLLTTSRIEVDPILANAISKELEVSGE
jgi:cytidylate kinase